MSPVFTRVYKISFMKRDKNEDVFGVILLSKNIIVNYVRFDVSEKMNCQKVLEFIGG